MLLSRRTAVILHDLGMVAVAWTLAAWPSGDRVGLSRLLELGLAQWPVLAIVVGLQSLIFWHYGLYRGIWRFASIPDFWNILRSAGVGVVAITLALLLWSGLDGVARSTLLVYPLLLVFLLGVPRLLYRVGREHSLLFLLQRKPDQRVLIVGAGRAGELLVREMLRGPEHLPVGFLDDQPHLRGAKLHGVPILGSLQILPEVVKNLEIDLIVIAMPSATADQMQRAVELCERSGAPFRTLPQLQDMVSLPSFKEIRRVEIDDLLGRDKVQLDWAVIERRLTGQVVMVTGGGGSIGSELCRQIVRLKPAALVIFERCEFNLYQIDMALRQEYPDALIYSCLGDICDRHAIQHVLTAYRPQVIFHAAAYKHVPMLQFQTREAVRNNVLGTQILAEAAVAAGCPAFVLISTDKAVNPTNIMGTSKRVAELFCQGMNDRHPTRFITVRFGNVLGSAGSVVPLFQNQIAKGGPVTVTHPEISRYFMTIPEACQLILQAGAMGTGGEIFVLDMGTPVRILYLAEQLIRLSGKIPGKDIKVVFTGLRPGEKLHEELFHADEATFRKTSHDKIMLATHRSCDWVPLNQALSQLKRACKEYDEALIHALLKQLVPEFQDHTDSVIYRKTG